MISIAHIIAQALVGMKHLRAALWRAVAVLALAASATAAAQTNSHNGANPQNEANDPLTPKMAFQAHDYTQPILSGRPEDGAHQLYLRNIQPHDLLGFDQIARASLPLISNSWGPHGTSNGIGDFTIYDMAIAYLGKTKLGAGPLFTAPTASAPALGSGKWQGGVQTVGG